MRWIVQTARNKFEKRLCFTRRIKGNTSTRIDPVVHELTSLLGR
jgi:hypothetical protein